MNTQQAAQGLFGPALIDYKSYTHLINDSNYKGLDMTQGCTFPLNKEDLQILRPVWESVRDRRHLYHSLQAVSHCTGMPWELRSHAAREDLLMAEESWRKQHGTVLLRNWQKLYIEGYFFLSVCFDMLWIRYLHKREPSVPSHMLPVWQSLADGLSTSRWITNSGRVFILPISNTVKGERWDCCAVQYFSY